MQNEKEKSMATIKSMVENKLRRKGQSTNCEYVREIVRKLLDRICESLPDGTIEGGEFENAISKSMDHAGIDPVGVLVESAMEDRNDLCDYPLIRQKLEHAINNWI